MQSINFVSPKKVKQSKDHQKASTQDGNSIKKATLTPKIHQGIWPNFCSKHLIEDPAGCSSWSEDKRGKMHLDFALEGAAEAYFDPDLIKKVCSIDYAKDGVHIVPRKPN